MDIQEMHLSVQQGVDKIHAQVADTLLTSEIDRELNKAIQQFINTRFQQNNVYQKGFEESQKRRDDLRTLVREITSDTEFKQQLRDDNHPNGALFVDTWSLPNDYMYLINLNTHVKRLQDCSPIGFNLVDQDPQYYFLMDLNDFVGQNQFNDSNEWLTTITLMEDPADPENSTNELAWEWGTVDWTAQNDVTIFPDVGSGVLDSPESAGLVQAILDDWQIGDIFWGVWPEGNMVFPGKFIVPVDIDTFDWMNWDASLGAVTYLVGSDSQNVNTVQTPLLFNSDILGQKRLPSANFWDQYYIESYSCRLVQHDDIHAMINDPFNKTKYSSPLTVMRGRWIDIYTDNLFIADKISMTYIRQPAVVDLNVGINCDLPIHTHHEIVRMAVTNILEAISDPRYESHSRETQKME